MAGNRRSGMEGDHPRTRVTEEYTVEIPEQFREELDLAPGDVLEWDITDGGRLLADLVEE